MTVFLLSRVRNRHIEARVKSIKVLCVKLFLNGAKCFAESLEMHNFTCTKEPNWISDFRYIPDNAKNVIVGASGFLFWGDLVSTTYTKI